MIKRIAFFLVGVFALPVCAKAHPISFKGGYGVMPSYSQERQELELNYTFDTTSAAAFNTIKIDYRDHDLKYLLPQFNYKLYRRNELDSQTNLYSSIGVGSANYRGDTDLAGLIAVQADYETRRVYTLLSGEHLQSSGIGLNRIRYRLGVAPYLGDFDDFQSWLIGQIDWTPELENSVTMTPLLRFFYQNYLVELGLSLDGDLFVGGIFHF